MKIYAVVVVYNGLNNDWIKKCLDSLLKSTLSVDIIAVDNFSVDQSVSCIKNNYNSVQLIQLEENLGFGKANNLGIKKAYDDGADYVFLLNQDAWVNETSIEELVKAAELNKEYGILSPIHLNGSGDAFDYNFSKYIIPPKCKNIFSDIYLSKAKGHLYDVHFVNAAAWLISRKCVETVGGFSSSFFHYGEDDNYCHRVLFHNLKIGVYPCSKIYHDREQRNSNSYFTDEKVFYRRKIIFQYSNPFSKRLKISYFKSEIKELYISLMCLNFKALKKGIDRILVLKSIDFKTINSNKEVSKIKGKSFL